MPLALWGLRLVTETQDPPPNETDFNMMLQPMLLRRSFGRGGTPIATMVTSTSFAVVATIIAVDRNNRRISSVCESSTPLLLHRDSNFSFSWDAKNSNDERHQPPQSCKNEVNNVSLTIGQRIGQTLFVTTRGIEIMARLSPLIILTPTAMAVSYIDRISRNVIIQRRQRIKEVDVRLGDDASFVPRFRQLCTLPRHDTRFRTTWASDVAWRYLLWTLQCLGPAFVKLGQWAATRRDLFPLHVCDRLSTLHDAAHVHDWHYTHKALVEAFGIDYEQRGLVVAAPTDGKKNDGILGSGSAAQVHRGTLHSRNVAIKVLHPNTRQLVERDLNMMRHIADFIDTFFPFEFVKMMSLPRAVSTFATAMERQVDLQIECNNLCRFRANFGCTDGSINDVITFPRPEVDWVSERVLVEEHAGDDAVPISNYLLDDSTEGLQTRKELAGPLLLAFLKMVFIDNFIHADLHPGNVLVRTAPSKWNPKVMKHTIIFLDAGIATSLEPNDKQNLKDLFKAVVINDGYIAGELMVERARYERCTSIPGGKHSFALGISNIVAEFHDRTKHGLTLGAVRVGALLGQVLDLCRKYRVEIDPAMSSVVVSMLVLEGLGRSLDPELNLMKAAMPFLLEPVTELLQNVEDRWHYVSYTV